MSKLCYHFFDYKNNIEGFSSDLFSTPHIIFIVLSFILVPVVCFLLRKTDHKKVKIFLRVFSIVLVLFELTKIIWESAWDISSGNGFNYGGILPLYTCSLFIYTLLFGAWAKDGKVKEYSLAFVCTINLISGVIGIIQCNGLNWYPFWTFGAFYSMFFHLSMFAVGMYILFTGFKKLEWRDIVCGWVPMLFLALAAIPASYEYGADYMQIREGSGIPLYSTLAEKLASINLRWVFSLIMLATYMILSVLVVSVYKLLQHISKKYKNRLDYALDQSKNQQ